MKRFTTADTGETVEAPAPPATEWLDGYDWIEVLEASPWTELPNWGTDGWDAGGWPYIILAVSRVKDDKGELFGLTTYCEGDLTVRYFRTQSAQWEAITAECFVHWKNGQSDGPKDLPDTLEQLGAQYRCPYDPRKLTL